MIETEEILHVVERKNPREYLMQIFKAWKWFAFSFIVCLIIGLGFLRYSTSIYSSEATILIVEDEENALLIRDAIDHKDKYSLARKTESESIILKSRFLLQRVVKSQRLNIQIFSLTGRTGLKSTESYQNPAFTISQAEDSDSILYNEQMEFIIHPVNSTSYELTIGNTSPRLLQINDTFTIDSIDLKLNTTSNYEEHWMDYKYKVVITPVDQVVTTLQKKIIINDEKSEVGVLVISLNGPTPLKNDDIINGLIQQYQTNNIFEKNKVSSNTNKFLSERISLIEKELSMIESSGESLKKQNDVLDVDIQYSNILLKQSDLENKILNTEVQLAVIQYVEEYVNEEGNKLVPVNLGLVSTPLVKSISAYNT
ncbi:MAG: tyrosine-protein kinase Etk/Wzc, partial [Crocinitomix sp.]